MTRGQAHLPCNRRPLDRFAPSGHHCLMTDAAPNLLEYSVSEISAAVKRTVEDGFSYVRIRGEISGFRGPHSSGHCYFSLKDERARIEAVVWRSAYGRLKFKPEEGIEVIATGRLTTFPGASKYQIVIDALEPAGVGALMALLEERRKKFAAEGLFDDARKKPLPFLPRTIGVVTSPTGAVIRDILHRLTDRCPVGVLVWPVRVQGETTAAEVSDAIAGFNALPVDGPVKRPDVLIVARGGGSLEDLWGFNEEPVVRAAAASEIPLISAVGHQTDWTLLDHVADRRAPTPTAAAEMAVPVRGELIASLEGLSARKHGAITRLFEAGRRDLRAAARALPGADDLLATPRRTLDELGARLRRGLVANAQAHRVAFERNAARVSAAGIRRAMHQQRERLAAIGMRCGQAFKGQIQNQRSAFELRAGRLRVAPLADHLARERQRLNEAATTSTRQFATLITRKAERLSALDKLLQSLSYKNVLSRGFALVRTGDKPLRAAAEVPAGTKLDIEFQDGHVSAVSTTPNSRRAKKPTPPSGTQGSLF